MSILDLSKQQQGDFFAALAIIKRIMIEKQTSLITTFINDREDESIVSVRIHFEGLDKIFLK